MDLYSCIGFACAAAVVSFTVRRFDPEAGRHTAIAAAALILLSVAAALGGVFGELGRLADQGGLPSSVIGVAAKAFGIAYLTELTSSLCRDLGEGSLAVTCVLTGRILLVILALPMIKRIAELALSLAGAL